MVDDIENTEPVRIKPWIDNITTGEEEKQAVIKVMDKGYLSLFEGSFKPDPPFDFYGGPKVQQLERVWCEYYGIKHAVSMNSATSGLYAAIGALKLGYGDEVLVSPYTMSACAVCSLAYGAVPIFADIELSTGCLDPDSIKNNITPRTKAIIVIHQFGFPADMDKIMAIASKYNLKIIEDCAQAHGAKYKGQYVGTFGDIGVFSLNVNKTIQCGEGAVCVTNDDELAFRLALIRNHGEAVVENAGYKDIVNIVGFNFRLSEIHAAIAIEQLKKLDHFNKVRIGLVHYLNDGLGKHICFDVPEEREDSNSTYYVYPLIYYQGKTGLHRKKLVQKLRSEGIIFYEGYTKPLYLQPIYQEKLAFKHGYPFNAPENREIATNYYKGACPNAEQLYFNRMLINEHVRLPHTKADMDDIIKGIGKVLNNNAKK